MRDSDPMNTHRHCGDYKIRQVEKANNIEFTTLRYGGRQSNHRYDTDWGYSERQQLDLRLVPFACRLLLLLMLVERHTAHITVIVIIVASAGSGWRAAATRLCSRCRRRRFVQRA